MDCYYWTLEISYGEPQQHITDLNHITLLFSLFPLREPHDGAHGRELHAAVAARSPEQLSVSPPPQQPGRPQLQRPLPVSNLPLGPRRLHQRTVRWVNRPPVAVMCLNCRCNHRPLCLTDMTNAATFRDLSKPVGALNKERLDRLLVSLFSVLDCERLRSESQSGCCALLFTGSLQRHAWTSLHVRQSLLVSRLRPLLLGQSWYVAHFFTHSPCFSLFMHFPLFSALVLVL